MSKCGKISNALLVFVASTIAFIAIYIIAKYVYSCHNNGEFRRRNLHAKGELQTGMCQKICTTKECLYSASMILDSLDENADPCENSYSLFCGQYLKYRYPSNGRIISKFGDLQQSLDKEVNNLISEIPRGNFKGASPENLVKAWKFYDHCMNLTSSEELFIPGVLKILSAAGITGWPNLPKEWSLQAISLDRLLSNFVAMGEYGFIEFEMDTAYADKNIANDEIINVTIKISPSIISWSGDSPLTSEKAELLYDYKYAIITILTHFGIDGNSWQSDGKELLILEKVFSILNSETTDVNHLTDGYSWYKATESKWSDFLRYYFSNPLLNVNLSRIYIVTESKHRLEKLKDFLESQPQRVLANYLALRFVMNHLEEKYSLLNLFDVNNAFHSISGKYPTRWDTCQIKTLDRFKVMLLSAYKFRYTNEEVLTALDTIYSYSMNATLAIIESIPWLEETTKHEVQRFLARMPSVASKLRNFCPPSDIDWHFNTLELKDDIYICNVIEYQKFYQASTHRWSMKLDSEEKNKLFLCNFVYVSVGAFVTALRVHLGVGLMRFPMISYKRPVELDFGSLGFIIGHEIGHIFENELEKREDAYFTEEYECLRTQYSQFKFEHFNISVNGSSTLSENLADNLAHHIAHKAYQMFVEDNGLPIRLPGLNFTNDQLFFIGSGQTWCEVITPQGELLLHSRDQHCKGEHRVVGTNMNMEAFAQAFHCPPGSAMNPATKCDFVT